MKTKTDAIRQALRKAGKKGLSTLQMRKIPVFADAAWKHILRRGASQYRWDALRLTLNYLENRGEITHRQGPTHYIYRLSKY